MAESPYNQVLANPERKVIAVDLDGTLCEGEFWGEGFPKPREFMIKIIEDLFFKGAIIIIYTARSPRWAQKTFAWLDYYGIYYHGVMMGKKPGADLYIDDKAMNVVDVEHFFEHRLEE